MDILRSTNEYVIRMKKEGDVLRLYVHRVKDGAEQQPRGYWTGSNYLEFDVKEPSGKL